MGVSVLKTCSTSVLSQSNPSIRWRQSSPGTMSPESEQPNDIFHYNNHDQSYASHQSSPQQNDDENSRSSSTEPNDTFSSPPPQENTRSSGSEDVAGAHLFPDLSEHAMSSPEFFSGDHFRPAKGTNGSGGKAKKQKCRNCDFSSTNKAEIWKHLETHLKPEKILRCPHCTFVTEYKHHMDFHMQNHGGVKPFQCDKCSYSCVNKSMLKSHLKSHSNVYQFSCGDCSYRTKYCHSLKIHLRKYSHHPGVVLDPDGKPNPNPVIDVYGNRRGPRIKTKKSAEARATAAVSPVKTSNTATLPIPMQPADISKFSALSQMNPWMFSNPTFGPQLMSNVNSVMPQPFLSLDPSLEAEVKPLDRMIPLKSPNNNNNVNVNNLNCSSPVTVEKSNKLTDLSILSLMNANANADSDKLKDLCVFSIMKANADNDNMSFARMRKQPYARDEDSSQAEMSMEEQPPLIGSPWLSNISKQKPKVEVMEEEEAPLNLCVAETPSFNSSYSAPILPHSSQDKITPSTSTGKSRRKGAARRLQRSTIEEVEDVTNSLQKVEVEKVLIPIKPTASIKVEDKSYNVKPTTPIKVEDESYDADLPKRLKLDKYYYCQFCEIYFFNEAMYNIHVGYHGFSDPFKCNRCGMKTDDKVGFYTHMVSTAHPPRNISSSIND